jgi:hypothetical protein
MNTDQLEGKWKQVKGVQERYGMAKEAATKEVDTFLKHLSDPGEDFKSSTISPNDRAKVHSAGAGK